MVSPGCRRISLWISSYLQQTIRLVSWQVGAPGRVRTPGCVITALTADVRLACIVSRAHCQRRKIPEQTIVLASEFVFSVCRHQEVGGICDQQPRDPLAHVRRARMDDRRHPRYASTYNGADFCVLHACRTENVVDPSLRLCRKDTRRAFGQLSGCGARCMQVCEGAGRASPPQEGFQGPANSPDDRRVPQYPCFHGPPCFQALRADEVSLTQTCLCFADVLPGGIGYLRAELSPQVEHITVSCCTHACSSSLSIGHHC